MKRPPDFDPGEKLSPLERLAVTLGGTPESVHEPLLDGVDIAPEDAERVNESLSRCEGVTFTTVHERRRLTLVPRVEMRGLPSGTARLPVTRPRERREQRHTARSTSSADSGDSDSNAPGDAGHQRRAVVVDDHLVVVRLVVA